MNKIKTDGLTKQLAECEQKYQESLKQVKNLNSSNKDLIIKDLKAQLGKYEKKLTGYMLESLEVIEKSRLMALDLEAKIEGYRK